MADQEKWGLTREEIEARLRKQNQEKDKKGPTRGGRSSGQGVKLLHSRESQKWYQRCSKDVSQMLVKCSDLCYTYLEVSNF